MVESQDKINKFKFIDKCNGDISTQLIIEKMNITNDSPLWMGIIQKNIEKNEKHTLTPAKMAIFTGMTMTSFSLGILIAAIHKETGWEIGLPEIISAIIMILITSILTYAAWIIGKIKNLNEKEKELNDLLDFNTMTYAIDVNGLILSIVYETGYNTIISIPWNSIMSAEIITYDNIIREICFITKSRLISLIDPFSLEKWENVNELISIIANYVPIIFELNNKSENNQLI